jgi:hypothetical protein
MTTSLVPLKWMAWHEEVVRLESQGYSAAEIAPRLNRTTDEVVRLMQTGEYQAQRLSNQDRLRFLFETRLMQLWGLSEEVIQAAQETVAQYRSLLSDPEVTHKELKGLRSDALVIMKDVLDRIGLRAPDKSELKVLTRSETEDVTPLETYEKRLELIKGYQAAGEVVPRGLSDVEFDG